MIFYEFLHKLYVVCLANIINDLKPRPAQNPLVTPTEREKPCYFRKLKISFGENFFLIFGDFFTSDCIGHMNLSGPLNTANFPLQMPKIWIKSGFGAIFAPNCMMFLVAKFGFTNEFLQIHSSWFLVIT